MITYKVDIIELLKLNGFNTNRIRQERIISESSLQAIREGRGINFSSLDAICRVCNCQPGDLIRYEADSVDIDE